MQNGKPFRPELLDEVVATSNRTLMTGFLLKRPNEYGENIDDGYSRALTHLYLGSVEESHYLNDMLWMDLKNKISCGDTIEVISPSGTTTAEVLRLSKKEGSFVSTLSGGLRCGIELSTKISPFSLLRKKLVVTEERHLNN